jgi:hypothetical protein
MAAQKNEKKTGNNLWASTEHGPRKKKIIIFAIFSFKEMGSKSKVLNISKPNLNWIQNRIKSNQHFGTFSNLKIDLNNQI